MEKGAVIEEIIGKITTKPNGLAELSRIMKKLSEKNWYSFMALTRCCQTGRIEV